MSSRLTPEALISCRRVGAPVPHPTEQETLVYSQASYDAASDKTSSSLFVSRHGLTPRRLTRPPAGKRDADPQWLPGAAQPTVLFLSNRSGSNQLWAMRLDGGEALQVSSIALDIECFKVAEHVPAAPPAEGSLGQDQTAAGGAASVAAANRACACVVFSVSVYADLEDTADFAASAERGLVDEAAAANVMAFDALPVRHWDTWDLYRRRNHLFLSHVVAGGIGGGGGGDDDGEACVLGPAVSLFGSGAATDCPPKPFSGAEAFDISTDGANEIAFVCRPPQLAEHTAWSTTVACYTLDIRGAQQAAAAAAAAAADAAAASRVEPGEGPIAMDDGTSSSSSSSSSSSLSSLPSSLAPWKPSFAAAMRLTPLEGGTSDCPCYSPDGSVVAFLTMLRPGFESDRQEIMLYDRATAKTRRAVPSIGNKSPAVGKGGGSGGGGGGGGGEGGEGAAASAAPVVVVDLSFDSIAWGPLGLGSKDVTNEKTTYRGLAPPTKKEKVVVPTTLFATAQHEARRKVYAIDIQQQQQQQQQHSGGAGRGAGTSDHGGADNVACVVWEHANSGVAVCAPSASARRDAAKAYPCRLAFLRSSLVGPAEIWTAVVGSGPEAVAKANKANHAKNADRANTAQGAAAAAGDEPVQQLTRSNEALMARVRGSLCTAPIDMRFTGACGHQVQAWFLPPPGVAAATGAAAAAAAVPRRSVPLVAIIHGGPQGAVMDSWHYRWNPQSYVSAGYAVLAVNFHGSTGFGQAFTDSISGDWSGAPLEDVLAGVDEALGRFPWLDPARVGALGASYGGYLINVINGHNNNNNNDSNDYNKKDGDGDGGDGGDATDSDSARATSLCRKRFQCLVNHDGVFDTRSLFFVTEELWFPEWEFRGRPWDSALYEKHNPSARAGKWRTPTLVIHGGRDFRLPDTEGLATFTALQRQMVPSRLVYFPKENHWVLNKKNSVRWHHEVLAWLDRWLQPAAGGAHAEGKSA